MKNTVEFSPRIALEAQFPEAFYLILKKDKNWRSKSNLEKWEVVNLVRKDILLTPIPMTAGIVETLRQIEDQILYLKIQRKL